MWEPGLRRIHRYLGVLVAPLVILQAVSGLALSLDVLGGWRDRVHRFLEGVDLDALAEFWNAVVYEVHFGSGWAGRLHTLAVGGGLVLLVATGVPIFVKIVARKPFRAARAAEEGAPEPEHGEEETNPQRWVAWGLGVVALALMALDVLVFAAAYRMTGQHVPQFYAAAQVQLHAAHSRAEFERLAAGDPQAEVARVLYGLERAALATEVLLRSPKDRDADRSPMARTVLPLEDLTLRRRVEGVNQGLRHLGELALRRTPSEPLPGAAYRRALAGVEASAGEFAEELMDQVERDRERFFAIHLVLFTVAFLFLVAVGIVFHIYETGRARSLLALDTALDAARAYEQRFRGLIRQAAVPLLVFEREGRIVAASLTAARLLGYPEEDLLTLDIAAVEPETPPEERWKVWDELVPGSPAAVKSTWRHRDGSDLPVVLSLAVVAEDGGEGGTLLMAQARQEEGGRCAAGATRGPEESGAG